MDSGSDPIVRAIALAEAGSTAEIRVHVTRRIWERRTARRAEHLFARFGMAGTRDRNAVLLYVNLRARRFSLVADEGVDRRFAAAYWPRFAAELVEDLHGTDPERAISLAVERLGGELRRHFPADHQERRE